jgi:2-octaprenylphenol hydroxylase
VLQEVVGKRAAFPLRIAHATDYTRPRVALIGYGLVSGVYTSARLSHHLAVAFPTTSDAAHTIHPLAGQGVNLGFADVASLTNSIIDAVHTGEPHTRPNSIRTLLCVHTNSLALSWRQGGTSAM